MKKDFYWQRVLAEVINKQNPNFPKFFTNFSDPDQTAFLEERRKRAQRRTRQGVDRRSHTKKRNAAVIEIASVEVGLTQRELETAKYFLQGLTIVQTAQAMGLQARTVEYYCKNIRSKVGARNKKELVALLQMANFL